MNTQEKEFIFKKLEKLSAEIWNVKHLAIILEELIFNDNGNLTTPDIGALAVILKRTACATSKQCEKIKHQLEV